MEKRRQWISTVGDFLQTRAQMLVFWASCSSTLESSFVPLIASNDENLRQDISTIGDLYDCAKLAKLKFDDICHKFVEDLGVAAHEEYIEQIVKTGSAVKIDTLFTRRGVDGWQWWLNDQVNLNNDYFYYCGNFRYHYESIKA